MYDNANTMSGPAYIQAKIRQIIDAAILIPCAAQSLNLAGQSAVDCCVDACSYCCGFVQRMNVFFSATTKRWKTLIDCLAAKLRSFKAFCPTHIGQRTEMQPQRCIHELQIDELLESIANDSDCNAETRHEAKCLCAACNRIA
jgi:hypothetical protein